LVRKTNQDSGCVSTTALFVADGMGGAAGGDLASALVVLAVCHLVESQVTGPDATDLLKETVFAANAEIAALVDDNPDLDGMGTTICGGIFDGVDFHIVHIGDSRAYVMSDSTLRRITHDHSYVQSLIDEGRLDRRSAMTHPHRSLLLRVLNGQPEIQPDFLRYAAQPGDRIMLCSDGLCGLVDDTVIAAALNLPDAEDALDTLTKLARAAGGTDNITIIIADVVESDAEAATPADIDEHARAADETEDDTTDENHTTDENEDEADNAEETTDADADAYADAQAEHTLLLPTATAQDALVPAPSIPWTTSGLIGAAADPHVVSLLRALRHAAVDHEPSPTVTRRAASQTPGAHPPLALQERQRYTPSAKKPRRIFWWIAAPIILVLAGGGWGVSAYISSQYYIGDNNGMVAIYQGLPGTIAGIDTSRLYETTTISLTDLPISWRDKVTATIAANEGGLDQARTTVSQLLAKSTQCVHDRAARPAGTPTPADGC